MFDLFSLTSLKGLNIDYINWTYFFTFHTMQVNQWFTRIWNIYLLQVNNRNTRKRCEICSRLTNKDTRKRHWLRTSDQVNVCWEGNSRSTSSMKTGYPTNTPRVFHVETTWKRLFLRCFNAEYTWCVCIVVVKSLPFQLLMLSY